SFIFILLCTAKRIIVGKDGTGQVAKLIPGIILAIILINFSLFFGKVIIDVSNIATLTVHIAIVTTCASQPVKLSSCFTQPLGLNTIVTPDPDTGQTLFQEASEDFGKAIIVSIGGTIFLLVTAFVFLSIAFMFAIRFVTIIMLLIFSPVAVIGT